MVQRDILGRNAEKDMGVRVRNLSTATPLASTSVTNGHTEFNGNESLMVKGSQIVAGWLIITGTLKVVGAFLLQGITTITGALTSSGTALFTGAFTTRGTTRFEGDTTQKGALHVIGNQDNTGTLDIGGVTTLRKNLNVVSGGKIVAGELTMDPGLGVNGGLSAASRIHLEAPVTNVTGNAIVDGVLTVDGKVTAMGEVDIRGPLKVSGISVATQPHTPNVWFNVADNRLYLLP